MPTKYYMKSHSSPQQQKIANFWTLKACKTPKTLGDAQHEQLQIREVMRWPAVTGTKLGFYGIKNTVPTESYDDRGKMWVKHPTLV